MLYISPRSRGCCQKKMKRSHNTIECEIYEPVKKVKVYDPLLPLALFPALEMMSGLKVYQSVITKILLCKSIFQQYLNPFECIYQLMPLTHIYAKSALDCYYIHDSPSTKGGPSVGAFGWWGRVRCASCNQCYYTINK